MHLGQISLCDSVGYNLKADEDKARILQELSANFGVKVIRRHHDTFCEKVHVPVVNSRPHFVSVRTNGNPYFLYLTRCNFVNQCILVDKKVQQGYFYPRMILLRLWFHDSLFDNTLFEGEMVKHLDGTWTFLINDLMALANHPSADVPLPLRITTLHDVLRRRHVPDDMDICRLRVKKYFSIRELRTVMEDFVPRLPYTCRGLYFKPMSLAHRDILLNFDDSLVKRIVKTNYKDTSDFLLMSDRDALRPDRPPSPAAPEHRPRTASASAAPPQPIQASEASEPPSTSTTTFWVRNTRLPDVYELYRQPGDVGKGPSSALVACVPSLQLSRALRGAFLHKGVTDVISMPCSYNARFSKWEPHPEGTASASS